MMRIARRQPATRPAGRSAGSTSPTIANPSTPIGKSFAWRFALGASGAVPLPRGGAAFPVSAVLAVLGVVLRPKVAAARAPIVVLSTLALGLAGFGLSAAVNRVTPGVTSLSFFAAVALFVLAGAAASPGSPQASDLLMSVSLGALVYAAVFGGPDTHLGFAGFWKYGAALPVTVLGLWAVIRCPPLRFLAPVVLLLSAGVSLVMNSRADALIAVLVAVLVFAAPAGRPWSPSRVIALAAALAVAGAAVVGGIMSGLFGAAVRDKTIQQMASGGIGPLFGRTEPPLSVAAITAHPLLGWGNVDSIDPGTIKRGEAIAASLGQRSPESYLRYWLTDAGHVSVHSVLGVSWIEGGLLGALFPITLIALCVVGVFAPRGTWTPLVLLGAVRTLWDVLFSPWAAGEAPLRAAIVVLLVVALREGSGGRRWRRWLVMSGSDLRPPAHPTAAPVVRRRADTARVGTSRSAAASAEAVRPPARSIRG